MARFTLILVLLIGVCLFASGVYSTAVLCEKDTCVVWRGDILGWYVYPNDKSKYPTYSDAWEGDGEIILIEPFEASVTAPSPESFCGEPISTVPLNLAIRNRTNVMSTTFRGANAHNINYTIHDEAAQATVYISTYLLVDKTKFTADTKSMDLNAGDFVIIYTLDWPNRQNGNSLCITSSSPMNPKQDGGSHGPCMFKVSGGIECYVHGAVNDQSFPVGPSQLMPTWAYSSGAATTSTYQATTAVSSTMVHTKISNANAQTVNYVTVVRIDAPDTSIMGIPSWVVWLLLAIGIVIAVGLLGGIAFLVIRSSRRAHYEQL